MKNEIETSIKTLLSQIKADIDPNKAVSISIAILNLANTQNALESKKE